MTKCRAHLDTRVELNFKAMARNVRKIRNRAKAPLMAVVKANAYGHGLLEVGKYLDGAGMDCLMVCKAEEALRLRAAGVRCGIHNFGPCGLAEAGEIVRQGISQSVFSDQAAILDRAARKVGKKAKIHVHVDTGMGRIGFPYYEALPRLEAISRLRGIRIAGISTTFTEDRDFDREQLDRFLELCRQAEQKGLYLGIKHAASSATFFHLPAAFLDMVRPGLVLYGYYPSPQTQEEDRLSLHPVLSLKTCVADTKTLRPGDSSCYHRVYRAKRKEKIAVLPAGYADGYPGRLAGRGFVLIRGRRYPVVGDISANHAIVRLGPDSPVQPKDEVVLIGRQGEERVTACDLARWSDVSVYKILIGINPLLPRKIV